MTTRLQYHIIKAVAIAWLAIAMVACGTARQGTDGAFTDIKKGTPTSALDARFAKLANTYGRWNDVAIPVTLNLRAPVSVSVGGTLTMTRDQSVNLSLRYLGFEVMNIHVTPDSVFGSYKLAKLYFAESISSVTSKFPLTVGNVQDLLLGRAFIVGQGQLLPSMATDVEISKGSQNSFTITPEAVAGVAYQWDVNNKNYVTALKIMPLGRNGITVDYSTYESSPVGYLAPGLSVDATLGNKGIDATLEYNVGRAKWNTGASRQWTAPKGWKRVTAASIINSLSGF